MHLSKAFFYGATLTALFLFSCSGDDDNGVNTPDNTSQNPDAATTELASSATGADASFNEMSAIMAQTLIAEEGNSQNRGFTKNKSVNRTVDLDMVNEEGEDLFPRATGLIHFSGNIVASADNKSVTFDAMTMMCSTDVTITLEELGSSVLYKKGNTIVSSGKMAWSRQDYETYSYSVTLTRSMSGFGVTVTKGSVVTDITVTSNRTALFTHTQSGATGEDIFVSSGKRSYSWSDNSGASHTVVIEGAYNSTVTPAIDSVALTIDGTTYGPYTHSDAFEKAKLVPFNISKYPLLQQTLLNIAHKVRQSGAVLQGVNTVTKALTPLISEYGLMSKEISDTIYFDGTDGTDPYPNISGIVAVSGNVAVENKGVSFDPLTITFLTDIIVVDTVKKDSLTLPKDSIMSGKASFKRVTPLPTPTDTFYMEFGFDPLPVTVVSLEKGTKTGMVASKTVVEMKREKSVSATTFTVKAHSEASALYSKGTLSQTIIMKADYDNSSEPVTNQVIIVKETTVGNKTKSDEYTFTIAEFKALFGSGELAVDPE